MGMYKTFRYTLKITAVEFWAWRLGLPSPHRNSNWSEGYLNAQEVRTWAEAKFEGFNFSDCEEPVKYEPMLIARLLEQDARQYITDKSLEASNLGLVGNARRAFLRDATKKYKVVFS